MYNIILHLLYKKVSSLAKKNMIDIERGFFNNLLYIFLLLLLPMVEICSFVSLSIILRVQIKHGQGDQTRDLTNADNIYFLLYS
jgi:hypothetical protein